MTLNKILEKANSLLKKRDFDEALRVFSSALSQSEHTNYPAAYGAGRAAGALRKYDEAIDFFSIASRIAAEKPAPLIELAGLSYRVQKFDDALLYLSRAESIAPLSEGAVLTRLRCHFALSNYEATSDMCDEFLILFTEDYSKKYEWTVRKVRSLFHLGKITEAEKLVQHLKDLDRKEANQRCNLDDLEDIDPIDVVLNCYRRPQEVKFQRWWIEQQSIPVREFWVWHNDGGLDFSQQRIQDSTNSLNDKNHKFYGRFSYGLLSNAKYLAYFDDDTMPGLFWLQNCLAQMKKRRGLYVTVGVQLHERGKYAPHDRCGWVSGDQQNNVDADLGGHAWFFERDWLRYFWFEEPSTFETGEDMHLSFAVQSHLSIPTVTPPHPKECMGLWGSVLGNELGQDIGSSSFEKAGNHFNQRDFCVQDLNSRGWRLLNE